MGLKRKAAGAYNKARSHKWLRRFGYLLLAYIIFVIGFGAGHGNFHFSGHSENANLPATLNYSSVNQVYQSLIQNYNGKLTETQLENGLKHGLAESTNDPYTVFFTAAEAKAFNNELNNSFSGIGAELGKDADGNLQVIAPIAATPAATAGLQAQDIIASINGVSTSGMSVDQAVDKIRGPAGTKVTLVIIRDKSQQLTLTITRENITAPSVTTKILPGNIGYMQISTFANDTSSLSQQAADKFKSDNVKGIIVDLRDNPGGLVTAAVNVSSLWLTQGQTVFQTRGTTGNQTNVATGNDELHGIPTVVLIDGGSASASEITTGALHDNGAAYVIGVKSYGKGVEQSLINFNDGSQLKVTVASWYRPNGQNINHKGITPDKIVTEPSTATATNDPQLQAAQAYLAAH